MRLPKSRATMRTITHAARMRRVTGFGEDMLGVC
jgi:hypothetical protein